MEFFPLIFFERVLWEDSRKRKNATEKIRGVFELKKRKLIYFLFFFFAVFFVVLEEAFALLAFAFFLAMIFSS